MHTAGAKFDYFFFKDFSGKRELGSAGCNQKSAPQIVDKKIPPNLVDRGHLKHIVEGDMQGEHQGDLQ